MTLVEQIDQDIREKKLSLSELQELVHTINAYCGWHQSAITGDYIPADENWWVKQWALVIAEMAEALEGFRKNLKDDHLPHRQMPEVELADAVIRILHMASRFNYDLQGALLEKLKYNLNRADHKIQNRAQEGGKKF